jgi:hypothetical protein
LIGKFRSKSGWAMSGPGNWTSNQTGYVLGAVYPRDLVPVEQWRSLDYRPPLNNKANSARGKNARPTKRRKKRTQANRRREPERTGRRVGLPDMWFFWPQGCDFHFPGQGVIQ